jgi:pimeloyl-ACP methyl ester carboxylesterase
MAISNDQAFVIKSIKVNGLQMAYLEAGQGPLVILLHGFPDNAHTWEEIMPKLAAVGFHAVAVFTRGYFPSDLAPDDDYSVETMAHDVLSLIEALGYEDAVVVGHDWGASVAYVAANIDPGKIRKLVTLAIPHPRDAKASFRVLKYFPHFLVFQFGPLAAWYTRRNNFAYLDYLYGHWSPSWSVPAAQLTKIKEDFARPGRLRAALRYYRFLLIDGSNVRKRNLYDRAVSVPTLTFIGTEDGTLKVGMFQNAKKNFTNYFRLIHVAHAGHFVHRERPEIFAAELIRFLTAS